MNVTILETRRMRKVKDENDWEDMLDRELFWNGLITIGIPMILSLMVYIGGCVYFLK